jgi:hypothetical protein
MKYIKTYYSYTKFEIRNFRQNILSTNIYILSCQSNTLVSGIIRNNPFSLSINKIWQQTLYPLIEIYFKVKITVTRRNEQLINDCEVYLVLDSQSYPKEIRIILNKPFTNKTYSDSLLINKIIQKAFCNFLICKAKCRICKYCVHEHILDLTGSCSNLFLAK